MHPLIQSLGLQPDQAQNHQQENQGDRRGISKPQKREAFLVHGVQQDFTRLIRPALGQNSDRIKDPNATDHGDGQHEECCGSKHGPSDKPKPIKPGFRPVNFSGLIEFPRNGAEACQEKYHIVADILPNADCPETEKYPIRR